MAERTWTDSQRQAIDTRDRTLLVSAAAGSGKTATLTERIISSLLDEKNPINIEDMLIVTYTRAAVGELRERISKAVRKAMNERPDDERLEKQLHMLPSAKISTIDAFCADILRANAERVGINPSFRVPDSAEAQLLAENILSGLLESIYEGELPNVATPHELDLLTDCLAQARKQSELPKIIRMIYSSTLNSLEGVGSIGALVDEFNPEKFSGVENTGFGKYCIARLTDLYKHYRKVFTAIKNEILAREDTKHAKIIEMIDDALSLISQLDECSTYTEMRDILTAYEFKKAASVSKKDDLPPIAIIRKAFKEEVTKITENFFLHSDEEWEIAYAGLYKQFDVLYRVICEFDRLFRQEKIRRGICEFSDVERLTYECLWQNGEKTDVAKAQAKLFRAVYIDEYQDVNSLQNKIFEAISTDTNRFMVGDIKQSIYEFRSANPRIFADMKKSFPSLGSDGDFPAASIFMSNNFRCDKGVIDFVNHVFDKLFYHLRDSIGYVEADRLEFSKIYDHKQPEYVYPEICLVPTIPPSDPRAALVKKQSDLVPEVVARKIKELLDDGYLDNGEKIQPRHIAIIMRNVKNKGEKYAKALSKLGIPSALAENEKFFINSDVLLVLCLLNSIDNPHKDVYLAGLMCSPIYGFKLGDVALIRKLAPADTLYDSLVKYAEMDGEVGDRVKKFLDKLTYYRLISEGIPTDKLLMKLYHETGLLALSSNKKESKDNLMLLYEHARKFESGSFKGLYNFISYINQLTGRESDFDKREAPGECDAVRIITAHGSKGLEYPVVFFACGTSNFNTSHDVSEPPRFEYEEGFGMGMFLRTDSGLALVRNSTKNIIKSYRHRKKIEEEARVLYVILTRARERLYVVGQVKSNLEEFEAETAASREYMSEYSVYNISSLLAMILEMKEFDTKLPTEFLKEPPVIYTDEAYALLENLDKLDDDEEDDNFENVESAVNESEIADVEDELNKRFNFEYPASHLTRLPGKLSVSRLYPAILDGSDEFAIKIDDGEGEREEKRTYLPKFRSPDSINLSAERGIATHMLLQFCNFERLAKNGAKAELHELEAGGFLSEKDAKLVRIKEVELFVKSRLLCEVRAATKVYRELRFNVKLPASDFTTDKEQKLLYKDEKIFVQGVIDCLYEDADGNMHLVDYKTDRLTPEELGDCELARRKLMDKHSLQLSYYAKAVELMFGKYPKTIEVYSLPLGNTLDVSM